MAVDVQVEERELRLADCGTRPDVGPTAGGLGTRAPSPR